MALFMPCIAIAGTDIGGISPAVHPPSVADTAVVEADAVSAHEGFWAVLINGFAPDPSVVLLRHEADRLLASRSDLERWRVMVPGSLRGSRRDDGFDALDTIPGLTYRIDWPTQTIHIQAEPRVFAGTALAGATARAVPANRTVPGAFVNYDVFVDREQRRTRGSALVEGGAFNAWGVGTSSLLARDRAADASRLVRLETTWTSDRPDQLATLRVGDAVTGGSDWTRSVRFGGLQWASNFATRPELITFPLPGLTGEAALPSTVDVYVNDALRLRREVPAGPFRITDLPVVTGQGETRAVVRDVLGREQVVTRPYYASTRLLQPGLSDFSYEAGFIRKNFAIDSDDYGRFAAVGTHRIGLTDQVTVDAHGELLRDQQTGGVGSAILLPDIGVMTGSLAASHSDHGPGALAAVGFERQGRTFGFGGNVQMSSSGFAQLGLLPGSLPARLQGQAFASVGIDDLGSFGVSYTRQDFRDHDAVRLASASYGVQIGRDGFLGATVLRFVAGERKTVFAASFTLALGDRTSASVGVTAGRGARQEQIEVQKNLPAGLGFGYRMLASPGTDARLEAGASAQGETGTYTAEVARFQGRHGFRGSASGGIALIDGRTFMSRRIDGSFAVVQLANYPDVRVYAENQLIGRTGADGTAMLPQLRAYQINTIRIEQADLPLDALFDDMQIETIPYFRSGSLLDFRIAPSRGALLYVVLDDGKPLPSGATATLDGGSRTFPSGLEGQIYLTGLSADNRVRVSLNGQSCELSVAYRPTSNPLPDLGVHRCEGIGR